MKRRVGSERYPAVLLALRRHDMPASHTHVERDTCTTAGRVSVFGFRVSGAEAGFGCKLVCMKWQGNSSR